MRVMRHADSGKLIALRHRPETLALALDDEDFIFANMPALTPIELKNYVLRLHNLAEIRPVIIEFGEGLPGQDELVACAFGLGAGGVVAAAVQKAASPGWLGIRMLNAGELLPFITLNGSCPPTPPESPLVSVVICAYNAERTMRACLESLRQLDYPNYEVIIVDDGSRDRTAEIAAAFPEFRLIRQPNKGLSMARNAGMYAALGEIVAYTDSDCVVDPHWLSLMVRAMMEHRADGCGGPNYAPHEEGRLEACVAASPGAPCHVLVADDRAEHLAGCNMVFRKEALLKAGGFDPQFTSAGDDVDICWRLLDAGCTLGFCPAAFVWHFRRNTVKAYYKQQAGYGRAESMLYAKYPERFNALGQIRWRGTIPGLTRTIPGGSRTRVRWTRRENEIQSVRETGPTVLGVLPLTAEWNMAGGAALAVSYAAGFTTVPALAMLGASVLWAIYYAAKAPVEKCHDGLRTRMLIAFLAYTGPIARTFARYRHRRSAANGAVLDTPPRQRPTIDWLRRTIRLAYWNENYTTRDSLLDRVSRLFAKLGHPAAAGQGWNDVDLTVRPDMWTRIDFKTADEEHEGTRLKNHVVARIRLSIPALAALAIGVSGFAVAAVLGFGAIAFAMGVVTAGVSICAASEAVETGRLAYRALEQSAAELDLIPLGQPLRAVIHTQAREPVLHVKPEPSAQVAQPAGR
jgi:GT2 family glycosyltransferase